MELINRDILELEGILKLYNWILNYDNSKVPTKRSLFLQIRSKLNLKILNKSNFLTPKTNGLLKNTNSGSCERQAEILSEKRYFPHKVQNFMGIGSGLYGTSIVRRSRPSTLCSIYPISAFSRIHETLLDASYKNSKICDYNNSSDGVESSEEYKSYIDEEISRANYNFTSKYQESRRKNLERGSEMRIVESKTPHSETEYDEESYNTTYRYEIDIRSLNNLMRYIKNIIRSRISSHHTNEECDFSKKENNFCFLTLWKKVEELTQQKAGELNEEVIVWQQLRDVLLLTGMSLKYPTWSGEQLTNIITRIIPKKMMSIIIENSRNTVQSNCDKNKIYNQGLSELYYTFIESSKIIFDLLTVSKLIQESLSKYIEIIKTLKCNKITTVSSKEVGDTRFDNRQLSSEDEDFLEAISTYSTCEEYLIDEDGFTTVFETEQNEYSSSNKLVDSSRRESKLIDSLGLFVDLRDVKKSTIDDCTSSKVNDSISFSNRVNMENSNTTIITSSSTTAATANASDMRDNIVKLPLFFSDINENKSSFEFDINNSMQHISENIINLGISRKLLQDLINETLIRNSPSSSLVYVEKDSLISVCRTIDDCIYHSNSILEHCHKNRTHKDKKLSRALLWFFVSIIIMISMIFVGEYNNLFIEFKERTAIKPFESRYFNSEKVSVRSLNSKDNLEFNEKDNSYSKNHANLIKASDCILSKNLNQSDVNSDICNVIGDITVVQKCFTNLNTSHRN